MKPFLIFRTFLLTLDKFNLKIFISSLCLLLGYISYSQPIMTDKEAFIYTLAANDFKLNELGYGNGASSYSWADLYADIFDHTNFTNTLNDEFKRKPYWTKTVNELQQSINALNFNKTFSINTITTFDKYDSELSYFPLDANYFLKNLTNLAYIDNHMIFFKIGNVFNFGDFDFKLKINPTIAENYVNSRKTTEGRIDRRVMVKLIYSVVKRKIELEQVFNKKYIGIYIHKMIFMDGSTILGEITPNVNYYDKVNLIPNEKPKTIEVTIHNSESQSVDEIIKNRNRNRSVDAPPPPPPPPSIGENTKKTTFNPANATIMLITVDYDGRVSLNIGGIKDIKEIKVLREVIAERYSLGLSPNEIDFFCKLQIISFPIQTLREIITSSSSKVSSRFPKGIPLDSDENQLRDWLSAETNLVRNTLVKIKFDESAPDLVVKKVVDIVQELKQYREGTNSVEVIEQKQEGVQEIEGQEVFVVVEEMPEFPGGVVALRQYIENTRVYPAIAKENGIQGKVYVNFVVEKDGSVSNSKIARSVDPALDKEALRVVSTLPKWKPGKQRGVPVRVSYTVPINFKLE